MTDAPQAAATTKPEDRSDLLAKARSFLASPQVQHQDVNAKRAFLVEKGLNDTEITELLRTIVCVYIPLCLNPYI
jgi:Pex14 N-terminal domain